MKEKVRQAIRSVLARGNRLTVDRVCGNGAGDVPLKMVQDTLREYRAGKLNVDEPWSGNDTSDLAASVKQADSYERIGIACRKVMEALADGSISGARATALKSLLSEARQSLKQQHVETPPEVEDEIVPIGRESFEVAILFEGIVSDEGRQRVKQALKIEVERDLIENPNVDGAKT